MCKVQYLGEINDKIADYSKQRYQLQEKLESLFDEQVNAEINNKPFDGKQIDQLSAELVRIDGLIAALERQVKKNYEIPQSNKKEIIDAAVTEYTNDSIQSVRNKIRLIEVDNLLWALMEEQKKLCNYNGFDLSYELKSSELFSDADISNIISEVKNKADILNNPELISLDKLYKKMKSKHPYIFCKRHYHSSEVRDIIELAKNANDPEYNDKVTRLLGTF